MKKSQPVATLFVCVNARNSGKPSCAERGARVLLDQLRAEAEANASEDLVVRASGCLKKCKKGPAVILVRTRGESPKKAPKKAWKRSDARFKRVQPEDVAELLRAASSPKSKRD
jgi:(2Fe-2S) ferredoxin